jgi:hypothetical protein
LIFTGAVAEGLQTERDVTETSRMSANRQRVVN